jgi:predicted esterase
VSGKRRWFSFTTKHEGLALSISRQALLAECVVRDELRLRGLSIDTPVMLVGHSQGAMLCLELSLRSEINVVGVSSYAAFLPMSLLMVRPQHVKTPITFLVFSSSSDRWIPQQDVDRTVAFLQTLSYTTVTDYRSSTLMHPFSMEWLNLANFETPEGS